MPDVTNWNGTVWGATTRGTAFAEIILHDGRLQGRFTVFEPGLGQFNARLSGQWSQENKITAMLGEFTGEYPFAVTMPQTGSMEATFDPTEGMMSGKWSTDTPSEGKFILVKMEALQLPAQLAAPAPEATPVAAPAPAELRPNMAIYSLITKTVVLGSYRLDEQAVRRLAELIKSGTNVLTPAINASHRGSEHIHLGVDAVLGDPSVPSVVYNMIIAANEPIVNVGKRTVLLTLKRNDPSTLFVSGDDKVWVEGKSAQVREYLEDHKSKATYILRNYGQFLNSVVFLAMLAVLPSVPYLRHRFIVVGVAFVLLTLLMYSWRLAANTKIFLREAKFAWYQRNEGWLLVLLEVMLAAAIAFLVHRFIGD